MDADFQQRYLSAEQAYGEGSYARARELAKTLLDALSPTADNSDVQDAQMAWRAVLALLLGNIHFHGLQDPAAAAEYYRLVLASQPPDTLEELADQGLERCRTKHAGGASLSAGPEEIKAGSNSLIEDPFLPNASGLAAPAARARDLLQSATPWLAEEKKTTPVPNPTATSETAISGETTDESNHPKTGSIDLRPWLLRVNL